MVIAPLFTANGALVSEVSRAIARTCAVSTLIAVAVDVGGGVAGGDALDETLPPDESPPPQALSRIAAHALLLAIAINDFMFLLLVLGARR